MRCSLYLLQISRYNRALKMADSHAKRPRLLSMKEKSYFDSYCDITVHEEMLGDGVRTNCYKKAIFACRNAIKNKVWDTFHNVLGTDEVYAIARKRREHCLFLQVMIVLDVGAGTGILSCFCAQAGAAKVYAVEASKIAEQAKKVVELNGLQNQVEVIQGVMEDVTLPEKVDVIVSEWMGYCLLYESMLSSVISARNKWLKPGGLILPDFATIYIAPVCDDEVMVEKVNFWNDMEEVYGVDMSCLIPFARQSLSKEVMVKCISGESVLSHEQVVAEIDLYNVKQSDLALVKFEFAFKCFGIADLQGFAIWFDVKFSGEKSQSDISSLPNGSSEVCHINGENENTRQETIVLSTSPFKPETHWKQSILYLDDEVQVQQDSDISGTITLRPEKYNPRFLSVNLETLIDNNPPIAKNYVMGYELPKTDENPE